jgi:hypothetical protein
MKYPVFWALTLLAIAYRGMEGSSPTSPSAGCRSAGRGGCLNLVQATKTGGSTRAARFFTLERETRCMNSRTSLQTGFDPDQARPQARRRTAGAWYASSRVAAVTTAAIWMAGLSQGQAAPLTPFRYESQAQRHCPADTVVWLNFRNRTYYLKGQRRYGRGLDGSFVCRGEARDSGYRRSLLGIR